MNRDCDVAFLSMEMLIPELLPPARDANFRGGLGILACDIMAGLKRAGISASGIVPVYNKHWIDSREISYEGSQIRPVTALNPSINGGDTTVGVLEMNRGGTPVFGLENQAFDYLYVDDRRRRLIQEAVYGKTVPPLLKYLGIRPKIIWCNESHVAIAAASVLDDPFFDGTKVVFTYHTPDPAGMETFPANWFGEMGINAEKYYSTFVSDDLIDSTRALMTLAGTINGVSIEHGNIIREKFPEYSPKIVGGIRNGTDRLLWLSRRLRKSKRRLDPFELWRIHQKDKHDLLDLVRGATAVRLDPKKPLIVWVRRIVPYKNQYPMLEPIIRVICAERGEIVETPFGKLQGLGMQMFAAGIPSYGDSCCHEWVEHFYGWMGDPQLRGKFAFSHEYNFRLLRKAAAGCDIWFASPWPGWEACGTGDMRAFINGNIVLTSRTGGTIEYIHEYNPELCDGNGFFIDPYEPRTVYKKLKIISNLFYGWTGSDDRRWPELRTDVFRTGEALDIVPMIEEYKRRIFAPLLRSS